MLTRNASVRTVQESAPVTSPRVQPVNQRFGERLRFLRRASNMTQVQLAAYLGIDRSFLSDVERGRKGMSLNFLDAVAKGFKISLSELLRDL